jgi:hypothetical protein
VEQHGDGLIPSSGDAAAVGEGDEGPARQVAGTCGAQRESEEGERGPAGRCEIPRTAGARYSVVDW